MYEYHHLLTSILCVNLAGILPSIVISLWMSHFFTIPIRHDSKAHHKELQNGHNNVKNCHHLVYLRALNAVVYFPMIINWPL